MENSKKVDGMKKLKELAEDIGICMMVTGLDKELFNAVPMTTKKVNSDGKIWFLSLKNSEHNQNIIENKRVELLYSDPTKMEFLSVSGTARIHSERSAISDLYDEETDQWFEGINDPNLTAIEFKPTKAHYWDTQANKYEALYHLGIATLTSEEKHTGDEGEIKL